MLGHAPFSTVAIAEVFDSSLPPSTPVPVAPTAAASSGVILNAQHSSISFNANIPVGSNFVAIAITCANAASRTITSVTVGGVTAIQVGSTNSTLAGQNVIQAGYGLVSPPTGASVSVVVSYSSNAGSSHVVLRPYSNVNQTTPTEGWFITGFQGGNFDFETEAAPTTTTVSGDYLFGNLISRGGATSISSRDNQLVESERSNEGFSNNTSDRAVTGAGAFLLWNVGQFDLNSAFVFVIKQGAAAAVGPSAALQALASNTATVSANLKTDIRLRADASANSILTASLKTDIRLRADASSVVAASANLKTEIKLNASVSSTSTATATLTTPASVAVSVGAFNTDPINLTSFNATSWVRLDNRFVVGGAIFKRGAPFLFEYFESINEEFYNPDTSPRVISWTDGGLNLAGSTDNAGFFSSTSVNSGHRFAVRATRATRQLLVICSVKGGGTYSVTAYFAGGGPSQTATTTVVAQGVKTSFISTIDFNTAGAEQNLIVEVTKASQSGDGQGYIALQAIVVFAPDIIDLVTRIETAANATASLSVIRPIASNISAQTTVTAALSVTTQIASNISVETSTTASLTVPKPIASDISVETTASASLTVPKPLAGSMSVEATATGALSVVSASASISVSLSAFNNTAVNLTALNGTDWLHYSNVSSPPGQRKLNGGALITNLDLLNTSSFRNDTTPRVVSWTDGTPTLAGNNATDAGLYGDDGDGVVLEGYGFSFNVPADAATKEVRVICSVRGGGTFSVRATLSGGGVAPQTSTTAFLADSVKSSFTATVGYKASSSGQSLTVEVFKATQDGGGEGYVAFQAAVLLAPNNNLTAAATAQSTASASLTVEKPLASNVTVQSTATGALTTGIRLTAAAINTAVASGALNTAIRLNSAVSCTVLSTADLTINKNISANAISTVTATGVLRTEIRLASAATVTATASANLDTRILLNTTPSARATVTGFLVSTSTTVIRVRKDLSAFKVDPVLIAAKTEKQLISAREQSSLRAYKDGAILKPIAYKNDKQLVSMKTQASIRAYKKSD